jgi:hypothetical protein
MGIMKKLLIVALLVPVFGNAQEVFTTINGTPPPYIFNGAGVTQVGQTFTFSGGGSSGFPITIGSTSIASGSTTTSISGLTLVAPNLGTPTALVLTNATGLTSGQVTTALTFTPTNAAVVPSTAPSAGQLLIGNAGGTAYAPVTASGSCTVTSAGVFTCGGYPASTVLTASSSTALNFTSCISGTYTNYLIRFTNILMSASAGKPGIRFSTNGGSTYDSSAVYWWAVLAMANSTPGGGGIPTATDTATYVVSDGGQGSSQPDNTINGDVYLYHPASTTSFKFLKGSMVNFSSSGQHLGWSYQGDYENTAAVNAFQVIPDTGTITSGTVTCQPLPN